MKTEVVLYVDDALGSYGFPDGHPWGPDRQDAFWKETVRLKLDRSVRLAASRPASRSEMERFHTSDYVERVHALSFQGYGSIDQGDTPAYFGVFEAASSVVGAALAGLAQVMSGDCHRTFQAIGGLHHARRERGAGFCVFNDCAVVIETLRALYGVKRIAYVDIDVHHGDGLYYPFEADPDLAIADLHEDGAFLYPGTGGAEECGSGAAKGSKLNIPMAPGAGDREFYEQWERALEHLTRHKPEFILFQCGADSIAGDPLAHLSYTTAAHAHAARSLCRLANELGHGRIMGFGGGGYDRGNLARAWNAVLGEFISASDR